MPGVFRVRVGADYAYGLGDYNLRSESGELLSEVPAVGLITVFSSDEISYSESPFGGLALGFRDPDGNVVSAATGGFLYDWSSETSPVRYTGGRFADILRGGAGDDRLSGLWGSDTLEGGAGKDMFRFVPSIEGTSIDTVLDIEEGETLFVNNALIGAMTATKTGEFVTIDADGAGALAPFTVRLVGASDGKLTIVNDSLVYSVDGRAPILTIGTSAQLEEGIPGAVTFAFSEDVTGFDLSDIAVTGGVLTNFAAVNGRTYTATLTPSAAGPVSLSVGAGAGQDAALNGSLAASASYVAFTGRSFVGTQGADSILGTAGANRISVLSGNDFVSAGAGHDMVYGGSGNDTIDAGAGDDLLHGDMGRDVLTGGAGRDIFVFDTLPSARTNLDRISDFSVADDTIHLENAIFTKVGKVGALAKGLFQTGAAAKDASDRIIYDKVKGLLFYDPDGTGAAAQVQIAQLTKGLKLGAADFIVI